MLSASSGPKPKQSLLRKGQITLLRLWYYRGSFRRYFHIEIKVKIWEVVSWFQILASGYLVRFYTMIFMHERRVKRERRLQQTRVHCLSGTLGDSPQRRENRSCAKKIRTLCTYVCVFIQHSHASAQPALQTPLWTWTCWTYESLTVSQQRLQALKHVWSLQFSCPIVPKELEQERRRQRKDIQ